MQLTNICCHSNYKNHVYAISKSCMTIKLLDASETPKCCLIFILIQFVQQMKKKCKKRKKGYFHAFLLNKKMLIVCIFYYHLWSVLSQIVSVVMRATNIFYIIYGIEWLTNIFRANETPAQYPFYQCFCNQRS